MPEREALRLPGVIAALTDAVVIGVPIKTSTLNGVDSLYSIVQMPSGIPVATVAINGAQNAGILAAQILALADPELKSELTEFRKELKAAVEERRISLKTWDIASIWNRCRIDIQKENNLINTKKWRKKISTFFNCSG